MRRWGVAGVLVAVDVAVTVLAVLCALLVRDRILPVLGLVPSFEPVTRYVTLWPALVLLIGIRAFVGLYPGFAIQPADELRRQTLSTLGLTAFILAGGAVFRFSQTYSRIVLLLAAVLLVFGLPLARAAARLALSRLPGYGWRVVVLGKTDKVEFLTEALRQRPALGLKPVVGSLRAQADTCILVPDGLEVPLPEMLDTLRRQYARVWLVPDLLDVSSAWILPREIDGHLALELRNNLDDALNAWTKRALDIVLACLGLLVLSPVLLVLVFLIAVDSRGAVLIRHQRIGKDGVPIGVLKFRTMVADAEAVLDTLLAADPKAREEWAATRKLRRDPRVTPVGRGLRRWSLDELPQLWNVLRGDMSLVGPRPIVADELKMYGERARLYARMRPGLTGLMQVSGRNDLSYAERTRLDAYYARNWSVWLDLVIVANTFRAVLGGRGAY